MAACGFPRSSLQRASSFLESLPPPAFQEHRRETMLTSGRRRGGGPLATRPSRIAAEDPPRRERGVVRRRRRRAVAGSIAGTPPRSRTETVGASVRRRYRIRPPRRFEPSCRAPRGLAWRTRRRTRSSGSERCGALRPLTLGNTARARAACGTGATHAYGWL